MKIYKSDAVAWVLATNRGDGSEWYALTVGEVKKAVKDYFGLDVSSTTILMVHKKWSKDEQEETRKRIVACLGRPIVPWKHPSIR